ncbi:MAG: polysaccharide deacetylase family protein [Candidatus Glassbacteria bacterium]
MNKVYLHLANPYQPLTSDKCLIWLAGTFAAKGCPLASVDRPVAPGVDELLLTNSRRMAPGPAAGTVFRLTSSSDRLNRLMLVLGRLYGKSRFYHATTPAGSNELVQRLVSLFKRPFRSPVPLSGPGGTQTRLPDSEAVPTGRRIVFRVNVDWDERGFEWLERWYDRFRLEVTLAVAGSEIQGRTSRVRAFLNRPGVDTASHSYSHYVVLPSRSRDTQRREIEDNQMFLEDLTGGKITGFVAPYAKYDRSTFEILSELGYRWFIRSWTLHPVPLQGTGLVDIGMSFFFNPGWETAIRDRLAYSDLALQLHLRDLARLGDRFERLLEELTGRGVRLVNCATFLAETGDRIADVSSQTAK